MIDQNQKTWHDKSCPTIVIDQMARYMMPNGSHSQNGMGIINPLCHGWGGIGMMVSG
jgi:hypothetical protein